MKEALFYKKIKGRKVKCELCPHFCVIAEGKRGFCGVRENRKGKLYSMVYGLPISTAVDPIEKKPLFQFAPGTQCLSIATVGCNLHCQFCQNYQISQEYGKIYGDEMMPEEVVGLALRHGAKGIAYTYTEPTVFFEYALDTMKLAKKEGLYNVWVSNGYTNPPVVRMASKYLDAVNVDLKGNDEFYKNLCGGIGVSPVYKALETHKENGVWIEVTNLLIPKLNDSEKDITELVERIRDSLGRGTPIHFSAFFPRYKTSEVHPTPVATLENAIKIAKDKGMRWVYAGNIYGNKYESTYCWKCGMPTIRRTGFSIHTIKEKCPKCGTKVDLKGMEWTRKV